MKTIKVKSIDEYYDNEFSSTDIAGILYAYHCQEGDNWFGDWSHERFMAFTEELDALGFHTTADALRKNIVETMSEHEARSAFLDFYNLVSEISKSAEIAHEATFSIKRRLDIESISQTAFANFNGVQKAQITQWIDKKFIIVGATLYSPRREMVFSASGTDETDHFDDDY